MTSGQNKLYTFSDGKYAILKDNATGRKVFYRYGDPWPAAQESFEHAGMLNAMLDYIDEKEDLIAAYKLEIKSLIQERNFKKRTSPMYTFFYSKFRLDGTFGEFELFKGTTEDMADHIKGLLIENPDVRYVTGRVNRIIELDVPPLKVTDVPFKVTDI
jgi:hypothetical protein